MKLNPTTLVYARSEVNHHLLPDLLFTSQLRKFLNDEITLHDYLLGESGFKRFLYDYRVGRTLQAGDEAKVAMLKIIRKFPFTHSPCADIIRLAGTFQSKQLSTQSVNGIYGFPQSFASKLLSVHRPDEVIPYDSYALKSINGIFGKNHKTLSDYYEAIESFRLLHFQETSKEVSRIKLKQQKSAMKMMDELKLDADKMLSWKLTDKYLWCMEAGQRLKVKGKR